MPEQSLQGQYAGFASRMFAFGIDVIILSISIALAAWFITTLNNIFGLADFLAPIFGGDTLPAIKAAAMALAIVGYYLFFWVLNGQTVGKVLMGLRVVQLNGERVSFFRAVLRVIGYWVSAMFLFMGFLWILIDDRRQGWHDKLAGTCVIYAWPARPDEKFLWDKL